MSKSLPARPNLEFLKKEAKDLHAAFARGDATALPIVRHLDFLKAISDAELLAPGRQSLGLQHMQSALAMEYGFRNWEELKARVEGGGATGFTDVEQLADLDPRAVQMVLRDCDDWVTVTLMATGSPRLRDAIVESITARHRARLEAMPEFKAIPGDWKGWARDHVLKILNFLLDRREITMGGAPGTERESAASVRAAQVVAARARFIKEAGEVPASRRTTEELAPMFRALATVARSTGLLSVDSLVTEFLDEPLLRAGAEATVDGVDVETLQANLAKERDVDLAALDRRHDLVVEGVTRIGAAYKPEAMRATLGALPGAAEAPDLVTWFAGMAARTSTGGLIAVEDEVAAITDDMVRTGMKSLVSGADVEFVRTIMAARRKALRAAREQRLDMAVASFGWIASGVSPYLIEEHCRAML